MEKKCALGCKHFTGGELRHHEGCPNYPDSFSEVFDKMEKELELLKKGSKSNKIEQEKVIQMTFSNGDIYHVPLRFVAENRAKYYAKNDVFEIGSEDYKREVYLGMNGPYSAIGWMREHMNWKDVESVAKKVLDGVIDFEQEFVNCEKEIVVTI